MKRILSVLLALVMIIGLLPMSILPASAADGTYEKATSIAVGDTVIIVCESKKMELSSFNGTSYAYGTAYTSAPAGTYEWKVVEGYADDTFAFQNSSGAYMAWSSGNSLKTDKNLNSNSSWKVSFSSGNAVIQNAKDNARKLQWNASSPRFACYTSAQTAVQLYKLVENETPGETEGTTAPACTHAKTEVQGAVAATCTSAGKTGDTVCVDCNKVVKASEDIAATGHTFVDGVCSCGVNQADIISYVKVDAENVTAGQYIIGAIRAGAYPAVYPATATTKTSSGKTDWNVSATSVTAKDDVITSEMLPADAQVVVLTGNNNDGFSVGFEVNDKMVYLGYTAGTNRSLTFSAANSTTLWKVGTLDNGVYLYTSNYQVFQNSQAETAIRGYTGKQNDQKGLYLFKMTCDHAYETEITAPTCDEDGFTTYTCSKCGDSYTGNVVAAIGHNYENGVCTNCEQEDPSVCKHENQTTTTTDATCAEAGSVTVTCDDCGETVSTTEIPATGVHTVENFKCTVCNTVVCPAADSTLTLPEATTLGVAVGTDVYTTDKYYVSGVVESIANTTYGNLTIKDEAGNTFYIYGTYSADGANRYDAMETKPAVNDNITVYGVIGNYKGSAQMKNGWITAHTPACAHNSTTITNTVDATCTEAGSTTAICDDCGETVTTEIPALGHNYVDGVCSVCNAEKPETPTEGAIDFTTTTQRLSQDNNAQVWSDGCLTVTNKKTATSNNVVGNVNPVRFYKGSELIIEFPGMTKLVIKSATGDYYTALKTTLETIGTVSESDSVFTVELPEATDKITLTLSTGQVRMHSISVSANKVCTHVWGAPVQTVAPTCGLEGEQTITCDLCGETKTETVAALGHVVENDVCTVCNLEIYAQAIVLNENDNVIIYNPANHVALSTEANDTKMAGVATGACNGIGVLDSMAIMQVKYVEGSETDFYLMLNGKYLTTSATGGTLSFTETADAYSVWYLKVAEEAEGLVYINSRNAVYVDGETEKKQTLEYYADAFTTYSGSGSAYKMQLFVKPAPVAPTIEITHISLDAANDALGFKATINGTLPEGAKVGFIMSVVGGQTIRYEIDASELNVTGQLTLRLKGIMAAGGFDRGIVGVPFIQIGDEEIRGAEQSTTMQNAIGAVNEMGNKLNDAQKAAIYSLYEQYAETIDAWFQDQDEDNNIATWKPTKA